MASLEDQIYQLFSDLLRSTREGEAFSFEGVDLQRGVGPKKTGGSPEPSFALDGSCGLLGLNHPLFYKTQIYGLLKGGGTAPQDEATQVIAEWESFISGLLDKKVYWSVKTAATNSWSAGRHQNFLNNVEKEKFLDEKSINIFGLFSQSFTLTLNSDHQNKIPLLSHNQLIELIHLLRFLKDGGFYGDNGLISLREAQLREHLGTSALIEKVEGLCVSLKKSFKHPRLEGQGKMLLFPLSFTNNHLKEVLDILEDSSCSS